MIQMMASENSEDWGNTTAHNNLTVAQVRDLLDTFCDMNPTWEDTLNPKGNTGITREQLCDWFGGGDPDAASGNYERAVVEGVGRRVIAKFLKWKPNSVRYAVEQIGPSTKQRILAEEKAEEARKEAAAKRKELRDAERKVAEAETEAEKAHARELEEKIDSELADAEEEAGRLEERLDETYDPAAGELFAKPIHAAAFRDAATRRSTLRVYPVARQVELAEKVLESLTDATISKPAIEQAVHDAIFGKKEHDFRPPISPLEMHRERVANADSNARGLTSSLRKLQTSFREDGVTGIGGYDSTALHRNLCNTFEAIASFYAAFGQEPPVLMRTTRSDGSFSYRVVTSANEQPLYADFDASDFEEEVA